MFQGSWKEEEQGHPLSVGEKELHVLIPPLSCISSVFFYEPMSLT